MMIKIEWYKLYHKMERPVAHAKASKGLKLKYLGMKDYLQAKPSVT